MDTAHVKGEMNSLADTLSRGFAISTEWKLDRRSFQWACRRVSSLPEVDLCATTENYQLPVFIAPRQMAGAAGIDCLAVDWNQWKTVYIFPPLPLVSRVLDKLKSFEGEAVLVIPDWPLRPWYARLRELGTEFSQFRIPGSEGPVWYYENRFSLEGLEFLQNPRNQWKRGKDVHRLPLVPLHC